MEKEQAPLDHGFSHPNRARPAFAPFGSLRKTFENFFLCYYGRGILLIRISLYMRMGHTRLMEINSYHQRSCMHARKKRMEKGKWKKRMPHFVSDTTCFTTSSFYLFSLIPEFWQLSLASTFTVESFLWDVPLRMSSSTKCNLIGYLHKLPWKQGAAAVRKILQPENDTLRLIIRWLNSLTQYHYSIVV